MNTTSHIWQSLIDSLRSMPGAQAVLIAVLVFFVVVAGNSVFASHYRRVGKPVLMSILDPRSFPVFNFNRREWSMLAGVFAVSMLLLVLIARVGPEGIA
jgi:hypothetical protein